MIARVVILLVVLAGWFWPAQARAQQEKPGYSYCGVSGATTVLRTITTGARRFVFQAAWGGIVPGKPRGFDGYLAWHYGPDGAAELQIVQQTFYLDYELTMPDSSRAAFVGPANTVPVASEVDRKQNNMIYRFDAAAVLAAFPDQHRVRLRIYAKGSNIQRTSVVVDLDAVRRSLADAKAANARLASASCESPRYARPEVTDPGQFTICTATVTNARINFSSWDADYTLNLPLPGRFAFVVSAGNLQWGGQGDLVAEALAARMGAVLRDAFSGEEQPMLALVASDGPMFPQSNRYYLLSGASGKVRLPATNSNVDWPALLALEKSGPVTFALYDGSEALLHSMTLPSGTFASVRSTLARLADKIDAGMRTPMLVCEPEQDIIIT